MQYKIDNLMEGITFRTHPSLQDKRGRQCDLAFESQFVKEYKAGFWAMGSDIKLVFGEFRGWVEDANGQRIKVKDVRGMIEIGVVKL